MDPYDRSPCACFLRRRPPSLFALQANIDIASNPRINPNYGIRFVRLSRRQSEQRIAPTCTYKKQERQCGQQLTKQLWKLDFSPWSVLIRGVLEAGRWNIIIMRVRFAAGETGQNHGVRRDAWPSGSLDPLTLRCLQASARSCLLQFGGFSNLEKITYGSQAHSRMNQDQQTHFAADGRSFPDSTQATTLLFSTSAFPTQSFSTPTGAQPSAITPYWCAVSRDCFLLVRGSARLLFLQVRWVQGACTVVQRLFLVRSECAMPASQSTFAFSALYLLFVLAFSFVILYEPLIPWNRPGARPPPRDPRSKIQTMDPSS